MTVVLSAGKEDELASPFFLGEFCPGSWETIFAWLLSALSLLLQYPLFQSPTALASPAICEFRSQILSTRKPMSRTGHWTKKQGNSRN